MKAIDIYSESGFVELSKRIVRYLYRRTIRKALPTRAVKYAGIPVSKNRKFGDGALPDFLFPHSHYLADITEYEITLVRAMRSQVRIGDTVTIVGGGEGVTVAIAAKAVGETGSVVCFEGSGEAVSDINITAVRNKVSSRVKVIHAVVGEAIGVYGAPDTRSKHVLSAIELPECDILELDCEGAEIIILRDMTIRPRAIVVETHGMFGAPTVMVRERLENMGYDVADLGLAETRWSEFCETHDVRILVGRRK
jgi:hypothetical protein